MADILAPNQRSLRMASVRQADTAPELALRRGLHALGLRFRVNAKGLPGRPDIVLPKHRVAVFVHGCFWHGHACRAGRAPATNEAYWIDKLESNRERDRRQKIALRSAGWRVWTVWECQLKGIRVTRKTVRRVAARIARLYESNASKA